MATLAPIPARVFKEMQSAGFDRTSVLAIAERAMQDQQAGVPVTKGRERYVSIPERVTYLQAWMASMSVNGPAPKFAR